MLLGTFVPKLDDKGRVILPAKFRDEFAAGLVMTRGQEGCVYVYSQREFEALHARMAEQAPKLGKQGRDYLRMFLSGAAQEIPDKQVLGRKDGTIKDTFSQGLALVEQGTARDKAWNTTMERIEKAVG
jgi:MraZ protein